jgi:hypothetical protein
MCESGTRLPCETVQPCAQKTGTLLAVGGFVLSFFMAGPEMVRWDLTVESSGQFRLTIRHNRGMIVEYFRTSAAALLREQELEDLLIAARGGDVDAYPATVAAR